MNASRLIQCMVYLAAALVLGYFTYMAMMWAVGGAPVHATQFVALLGATGLLSSAFVTMARPSAGRAAALVSLAALGALWIPGVVELVPRHDVIVSPVAFVVAAVYFAAAGFALLYPRAGDGARRPSRWSWGRLSPWRASRRFSAFAAANSRGRRSRTSAGRRAAIA